MTQHEIWTFLNEHPNKWFTFNDIVDKISRVNKSSFNRKIKKLRQSGMIQSDYKQVGKGTKHRYYYKANEK